MPTTARTLLDHHAIAEESELPVRELFFDSEDLRITHVALDAGGWFSSREVLVAASRFDVPTDAGWPVAMSRGELEAAPVWEDSPGVPVMLPPLIVGPFGHSISPLLASAQIAEANEDEDSEVNRTTERLRKSERATAWLGLPAFADGRDLGTVRDLTLDDDWRITAIETDEGTFPRERLRHIADQGHLIFD